MTAYGTIHLGCEPDGEPPWDELDDGIRETVRWLWSLGFQTTDSGDGRRQGAKAEMAEALDVPHVFMVCAPEDMIADADRLGREVIARGVTGETLSLEATYFPLGGIGVIQLIGIDDQALGLVAGRPA
ncbi:MAG TPA: hypothetical protein VFT22_07525 [Kofleriaceae bacterium]|nr:hypothetical protein [Kofleriaceae bacterium]